MLNIGISRVFTYVTQNADDFRVSCGDDEEVDIDIQDDGPAPYQVVQVGAAQADQSGEHMITYQLIILLSNACSAWPRDIF